MSVPVVPVTIPAPPLRSVPVGGRHVEFRLRDPESVRAAAVPTDGGLSFLQIDHAVAGYAKRATEAYHAGTTGAVTRFEGDLDDAAMARALTEFARRHEELRAHYAMTGEGPVRLVAPAEVVEFDVSVGEPAELASEDVGACAARRVAAEAVFDLIPGYVFGAVAGRGEFSFYLGFDHAHSDGMSQVAAIDEISRLYAAQCSGGIADLPPAPGFGESIRSEKQVAAEVSPDDPRVDVWREALTRAPAGPVFPLDLGLPDDGAPAPAEYVERAALTAEQAERCDRRCKEIGASFTGLVFAALAAAEAELTGAEHYFTVTVMSTREDATASTQGWLVNFAPVFFDVPAGEGLDDLAVRATEAVRRARSTIDLPVHAALMILVAEGRYQPDGGSPQMVSFADMGRLEARENPMVAHADFFPGIGRTRNANIWMNRYLDRVGLWSLIPANDTARTTTGRYFDAVIANLRAFAR